MSLDGKLMATLFDGSLLVDRNGAAALSSSMSKVRNLYSPRSADPIALMQSGEIISSEKRWYGVSSDPAVAVKVTVYGDLFWLTQEGRLWSYRRSSTAKRVVDQSVDPIVSFKINDRGNVAYVSAEGRLGRDGVWLIDRFVGIASYWIDATGHVSGKTNEGREFYY
jgi:hypothetical protein